MVSAVELPLQKLEEVGFDGLGAHSNALEVRRGLDHPTNRRPLVEARPGSRRRTTSPPLEAARADPSPSPRDSSTVAVSSPALSFHLANVTNVDSTSVVRDNFVELPGPVTPIRPQVSAVEDQGEPVLVEHRPKARRPRCRSPRLARLREPLELQRPGTPSPQRPSATSSSPILCQSEFSGRLPLRLASKSGPEGTESRPTDVGPRARSTTVARPGRPESHNCQAMESWLSPVVLATRRRRRRAASMRLGQEKVRTCKTKRR